VHVAGGRGKAILVRGSADGGRHEERGAHEGVPTRKGEEAHFHEGPVLHPLELQDEEVLELESRRRLLHALAFEELVTLDPFLRQVGVDRITHTHYEATGRAQPAARVLRGGLDEGITGTSRQCQEDEPDLAGGEPEAVPRGDRGGSGGGGPPGTL